MTIDAIIAEVQGRTHSEGDEPARDELLVAEVLRLRAVIAAAYDDMTADHDSGAFRILQVACRALGGRHD